MVAFGHRWWLLCEGFRQPDDTHHRAPEPPPILSTFHYGRDIIEITRVSLDSKDVDRRSDYRCNPPRNGRHRHRAHGLRGRFGPGARRDRGDISQRRTDGLRRPRDRRQSEPSGRPPIRTSRRIVLRSDCDLDRRVRSAGAYWPGPVLFFRAGTRVRASHGCVRSCASCRREFRPRFRAGSCSEVSRHRG